MTRLLLAAAMVAPLRAAAQHATTVPANISVGRPSANKNYIHRSGILENLASSATAYVVSKGKILYVTDIFLTAFNTNVQNVGLLQVVDGPKTKVPVTIPAAGVGTTVPPMVSVVLDMLEPEEFTTNFAVHLASGTITYSIHFVGYEE